MSTQPAGLAGLLEYARSQRVAPTPEELAVAATQGDFSDADNARILSWAEAAVGRVPLGTLTDARRPLRGIVDAQSQSVHFTSSGLVNLLEPRLPHIKISTLAFVAMASVFCDRESGTSLAPAYASHASQLGIESRLFSELISSATEALKELT